MAQIEVGQVVTYYPAAEEFGPHEEDNAPRAAQIVDIHKGKGLVSGLTTLRISGPIPGRGPFKVRAFVPPFVPNPEAENPAALGRRGMYDLSKVYEKHQGKLTQDAFEDAEEQRPPSPAELAAMVAKQSAKIDQLERELAKASEKKTEKKPEEK